MWTRRYGGPEDQQCLSGQRTLDGGYVLSGFKYFNNDHVNMYVVKTDSAGHQQWHQWYGSAWIDNPGFILQLPDSGYVLAGAQRLAAQGVLYPALYRLDKEGAVIWAEVYDQLEWGPFFTIPIHIPGEGYTIAGTMKPLGLSVGRLTKVDLDGELLWDREYRTNNQADHYFYDVKRTLDGGYIMAGTAFDSLLVSQDAWLVKVDSFGCLVPGCQVFDGLEEQMTDLGDVLEVYPNPARDQATVHLALPQGLERKNLRLALVSAEGKLVHEEAVPATATMHSLELSRYPAGLYFVHLRDGARWLAGTKLVLSPP
ncbi:MAG: T9SS type A sorting domain-containing protein [Flavobacteriales bacterium]|nr:T9SS type A sorting domain-containing protein [Flavobacteriales bacterium]